MYRIFTTGSLWGVAKTHHEITILAMKSQKTHGKCRMGIRLVAKTHHKITILAMKTQKTHGKCRMGIRLVAPLSREMLVFDPHKAFCT